MSLHTQRWSYQVAALGRRRRNGRRDDPSVNDRVRPNDKVYHLGDVVINRRALKTVSSNLTASANNTALTSAD